MCVNSSVFLVSSALLPYDFWNHLWTLALNNTLSTRQGKSLWYSWPWMKPSLYEMKVFKVSFFSAGLTWSCCCSVTKSCPTLCNPMDCSTLGFPVPHCLPEFAQTHAHWVDNAIQPSHPLSPPSHALNISQLQDLFKGVGSSHQVASASTSVLPMNIQDWFPLG